MHAEVPRRTTQEVDLALIEDLRQYETYRSDKIRDMHISYARSVVNTIIDGMPLERVVQIVGVEAEYKSLDVTVLYELINHFLQENEYTIHFDDHLNVYEHDTWVLRSGITDESLVESAAHKVEQETATVARLAHEAAQRILGGFSVDLLMPFIKADLVADDLDNSLVARQLNEQFIQAGSPLRFNQYLEQVDI